MYKTFFRFSSATVLGLGMMMSAAHAQDQPAGPPPAKRGAPMDPEQEIQHLRQQLKLSDDQVGQIRPILADAQKQSMAVRGDSTLAREDMRAKMMSIRQDSAAKIREVLTDPQKAQYDQMIAKRQQMMMQRRQQPPTGGDNPTP